MCPSSPPPHRAEPDKTGPLVLWYNQIKPHTHYIKMEELSFLLNMFCTCVSSVCRVFLHLHGGSDQRAGAGWLHLWLHGLLSEDGEMAHTLLSQPSTILPQSLLLNVMVSPQGEPHLSSAYALMMSYWEGVIHLTLFLIIIRRMFEG